MTHKRKNFIVIQEKFLCGHCGKKNAPAKGTCRNHCTACLWSKHVDATVPGDRESLCQGMMEPKTVEGGTNRKGYSIIHHCTKCPKQIRNKAAPDDDTNTLILIAQNNAHNLPHL